jgi:hypothetical protein
MKQNKFDILLPLFSLKEEYWVRVFEATEFGIRH